MPGDVIDDLLANIFHIKNVLDAVILLVGVAMVLALILVFSLLLRLRQREIRTVFRENKDEEMPVNFNTKSAGRSLLAGAFCLLVAPVVPAAGFYLPEVGTPHSLGTGGVGNPTNRDGADASWTNPAGMTGLDEDEIVAGVQFVLPKAKFDSSVATAGGSDGGNAGVAAPIPSFFYVNKLSDRLRLGFSLVAPLGGGLDYGDDFVGRYSTINAELAGVALSPSLAWQVNDRLSLGAGVSIIYTVFNEDIAVNPALVPTGNGADGKLKIEDATDWGYQPFFGLTYQFSERALLGVVYRAEMDTDLDGDVKTKNLPGVIGADSIDISWNNPQWLEAGLSYKLDDKNTLLLNAGWQEWSKFSKNTLAFSGGLLNPAATVDRNWDNTWHGGVAFRHLNGDHGTSLGFSYESSPVDDKHRTFDLPMDEIFKGSFSYFWKGKKNLDFAIGSTLYWVGDARIDQTSQGVRAKGKFDTNYILFLGGTLKYTF